ncbi:MAG: hypothetical protein ACK55I_35405, partial [bacterium]
ARLRRQGAGQHVRHAQAGLQAPVVTDRGPPRIFRGARPVRTRPFALPPPAGPRDPPPAPLRPGRARGREEARQLLLRCRPAALCRWAARLFSWENLKAILMTVAIFLTIRTFLLEA